MRKPLSFVTEWPRNQLTDYFRPLTIMFDASLGTLCMAVALALGYNSTSLFGLFLNKILKIISCFMTADKYDMQVLRPITDTVEARLAMCLMTWPFALIWHSFITF